MSSAFKSKMYVSTMVGLQDVTIAVRRYSDQYASQMGYMHYCIGVFINNRKVMDFITNQAEIAQIHTAAEYFKRNGDYASSWVDDLSYILNIKPYGLRLIRISSDYKKDDIYGVEYYQMPAHELDLTIPDGNLNGINLLEIIASLIDQAEPMDDGVTFNLTYEKEEEN